jgi:ATP-dependent helicase HrpB
VFLLDAVFCAPMRESGLPIDDVLPQLRAALGSHRSVVLQAPPGAGKSTVVPLALLHEPWMRGKRLIMLEPRRLAARAVAQRMASSLREAVGETVGYRMRLDTRVSRNTRIEVVTEGVLTRMLQSDPSLEGVAAVIFDEFHERSLQADMGLALSLDARDTLAPDLKLIVMSATLDGERVAALLGDAPIVSAQGRMFPVETRFAGKSAPVLPDATAARGSQESPERMVAQIVLTALDEEPGDVLVFLPGAREIRRVQALIEERLPQHVRGGMARRESGAAVTVLPLFGDLSASEQDAALAPAASGTRKVVLATNIAETSLTIPGVRIVVDSGLVRRAVFDPSTGMSRLETQRISRASADQRQGRAGRVEPGVCYRAWSESAQRSLAPFSPPEITDADLTPLALDLANWGIRDANDLRWLDVPPAAMLASARDLLAHLGALDQQGRITPHGREMATLGVHPRLAHMLLRARELGALPMAADFAALLSERDLLRGAAGSRDADIRSRLDVFRSDRAPPGVDWGAFQRAKKMSRDLYRRLSNRRSDEEAVDASRTDAAGATDPAACDADAAWASGRPVEGATRGRAGTPGNIGNDRAVRDAHGAIAPARDARRSASIDAGVLLAFAYPDRIGRRRAGSDARYTLANGRGAHFADTQSLGRQDLIVAVDLDDRERDARILLAAPLARADLERHFADQIVRTESVEWSSRDQAVIARRVIRLDAAVLEEQPLPEIPADAARAAMLTGARELGITAFNWTRDARDLQARMEFVRKHAPDASSGWPAVDDASLAATMDDWLAPWLDGITRKDHLSRISLTEALRALLPWDQQRKLDELAPTHLQVPTGSNIRIDYLDESAPVVAVRLQEVFGLEKTPMIGGGRVPITFKLLSPAQRPVQVTKDLAGFWRGSYADVRKDMRGRYPKHYWPENPLEAEPVRGVRRKPSVT